jgi:glutaredoxin 3
MNDIKVYSTLICPYCHAAKNLLNSLGLEYQEIRIDMDPEQRSLMMQKSGRTSVPQIFINDHHVGGFDDLHALHRAGKLCDLLNS